jgi:hypothetical protein
MTTMLDFLGAVCLVAFAYFAWPPAAFAVAGVLLLAASWKARK